MTTQRRPGRPGDRRTERSSAKPSARPSARPSAKVSSDEADWKPEQTDGTKPAAYPRAVKKTPADSRTSAPRRKKMTPRMRRARRRKIRTTLILLLVLAILGGAGTGAVFLLRGGSFKNLNKPYSVSYEFSNSLTRKEELKAVPMAADLCVVTEDVPLETATLADTQNGLLMDIDQKKVLYAQKAYERVYPASITKIITGLLVLKNGKMDDVVTITEDDLNLEEGAQTCGFIAGDKLTVEQLFYCLLVYSGNDAASALARYIGGSIPDFVGMMNAYAEQLGCTGTHFTNPHGLQDENHFTTPYDIYLFLNEAYKYPKFTEITQLPSYTVKYTRTDGTEMATFLEATDHYLTGEATPPRDVTVLGGKTGTTKDAGNCLALLSQNAYGHPFVSIVMNAGTKDVLYQQMNSLLQVINGEI